MRQCSEKINKETLINAKRNMTGVSWTNGGKQ